MVPDIGYAVAGVVVPPVAVQSEQFMKLGQSEQTERLVQSEQAVVLGQSGQVPASAQLPLQSVQLPEQLVQAAQQVVSLGGLVGLLHIVSPFA